MMKKGIVFLVTIMILFIQGYMYSQEETPTPSPTAVGDVVNTFSIEVYNETSLDHHPVEGAYVEINGVTGDSGYTDADGKCLLTLTVHDTGSVTVYASAPGFDTYVQEFNFGNINTTMEIGLYADPYAPLAAPTPGPVTTAHQQSAYGVFVVEAETDVFGSHLGISELPVETAIPGYMGSGYVVITDTPTTMTIFLDPRENNTYDYGWYSIGIRTYDDGEWKFQGTTHPEMLFIPEESCFMIKLVCPIDDYVIDRIVVYGSGLYDTARNLSLVPQTISLNVGGATSWDTYRDLNLNAFVLLQDPFIQPSVTPEPTPVTPEDPEVVLEPDYISFTYPETSDTATVTYAYTSGWSLVGTNAAWLTVTPEQGTIGTVVTATVNWSDFNPGDSRDAVVTFQNNGTSGMGTLDVHAYYPSSITPEPTPTPEQTPPVSEPTSTIPGTVPPSEPTPTNSGATQTPPGSTTMTTVSPTEPSTATQHGMILGDVNDSGSIDIVDALLVAQYYVGLTPSVFIEAAADTNCDGSVNIVDALLIAQYYVGLIEQFC